MIDVGFRCLSRADSSKARRIDIYTGSQNIPPLTCYNLGTHDPITITFGRSVRPTKKVRNQMMLCFPTSPLSCFCITLRNRKPRRQHTGALCLQHSPIAAVLDLDFLSPEPYPQQLPAERTDYKILGVIQQREYESLVKKIEEIKQLVQLTQCTNIQHLRENCIFAFPRFTR